MNSLLVPLIAAAGTATIIVAVAMHRRRDRRDWEEHFNILEVPLIDGSRSKGWLMRRRIRGTWQYRRMTDDETREHAADFSW
jgi:hypothetical protein